MEMKPSVIVERTALRRVVAVGLLVLAGCIGCGLNACYLDNVGIEFTLESLYAPMILAAAYLVAYGVLEGLGVRVDPLILFVILLLCELGLTFVERLSALRFTYISIDRYLLITAESLLAMVAAAVLFSRTNVPNVIARHRIVLLFLAIALLISSYFCGEPYYWLRVGSVWINVRTWSMILSISYVFFALTDGDETPSSVVLHGDIDATAMCEVAKLFVPLVLPAVVMSLLGMVTNAIILLICISVMLYMRTGSLAWAAAPLALIAAFVTWHLIRSSYATHRLLVFFDPLTDPWGLGYQTIQARNALVRGGLVGRGIGLGTPDLIPEVEGSGIFAAVCEELGVMGGAAVAFLYVLLTALLMGANGRASGGTSEILIAGMTCSIAVEALFAMGFATGLFPVFGTLLPYVAFGASSLVALGCKVGLVLGATGLTVDGGEVGVDVPMAMRVRSSRLIWLFALCVVVVMIYVAAVALL